MLIKGFVHMSLCRHNLFEISGLVGAEDDVRAENPGVVLEPSNQGPIQRGIQISNERMGVHEISGFVP